jgi:NAD(P)H-dependent FMN reductase
VAKIDSFDAFVLVTAEYNHGIRGTPKNAIDFLFKEQNCPRTLRTFSYSSPQFQENYVNWMLDQVIAWDGALRILRTGK